MLRWLGWQGNPKPTFVYVPYCNIRFILMQQSHWKSTERMRSRHLQLKKVGNRSQQPPRATTDTTTGARRSMNAARGFSRSIRQWYSVVNAYQLSPSESRMAIPTQSAESPTVASVPEQSLCPQTLVCFPPPDVLNEADKAHSVHSHGQFHSSMTLQSKVNHLYMRERLRDETEVLNALESANRCRGSQSGPNSHIFRALPQRAARCTHVAGVSSSSTVCDAPASPPVAVSDHPSLCGEFDESSITLKQSVSEFAELSLHDSTAESTQLTLKGTVCTRPRLSSSPRACRQPAQTALSLAAGFRSGTASAKQTPRALDTPRVSAIRLSTAHCESPLATARLDRRPARLSLSRKLGSLTTREVHELELRTAPATERARMSREYQLSRHRKSMQGPDSPPPKLSRSFPAFKSSPPRRAKSGPCRPPVPPICVQTRPSVLSVDSSQNQEPPIKPVNMELADTSNTSDRPAPSHVAFPVRPLPLHRLPPAAEVSVARNSAQATARTYIGHAGGTGRLPSPAGRAKRVGPTPRVSRRSSAHASTGSPELSACETPWGSTGYLHSGVESEGTLEDRHEAINFGSGGRTLSTMDPRVVPDGLLTALDSLITDGDSDSVDEPPVDVAGDLYRARHRRRSSRAKSPQQATIGTPSLRVVRVNSTNLAFDHQLRNSSREMTGTIVSTTGSRMGSSHSTSATVTPAHSVTSATAKSEDSPRPTYMASVRRGVYQPAGATPSTITTNHRHDTRGTHGEVWHAPPLLTPVVSLTLPTDTMKHMQATAHGGW